MSSETVTRNDLTAILNEVLPDAFQITYPTVSITATTGVLKSYNCVRFGNAEHGVVVLQLVINNASAVASGGNIFVGTLNTQELIPITQVMSGGFWGATPIQGSLQTSGAIGVRNASASSVTISGSNTTNVSFTYIV